MTIAARLWLSLFDISKFMLSMPACFLFMFGWHLSITISDYRILYRFGTWCQSSFTFQRFFFLFAGRECDMHWIYLQPGIYFSFFLLLHVLLSSSSSSSVVVVFFFLFIRFDFGFFFVFCFISHTIPLFISLPEIYITQHLSLCRPFICTATIASAR